jgi:hypothetical protein
LRVFEHNKADLSYGDMRCLIQKIENNEQDKLITYLENNNHKFVHLEIYDGRVARYNKNRCKITVTFNIDYLNEIPENIEDFLVFRVRTDTRCFNRWNRRSILLRGRNVYTTQVIEIKEIDRDSHRFKHLIKSNMFRKARKYIVLNEKSISRRADNTMKKFVCAVLKEINNKENNENETNKHDFNE